jgi:hypothetical protein
VRHNPRIRLIKRSRLGRAWWYVRFAALSLFRGRLQCPFCRKTGTWNPHDIPPRLLCKWCGLYEDIRRTGWCRPCTKQRVWMLKPLKPGKLPPERVGRIDPWRM